jgi:FlaG/FlaF family flagellin (archaellin)
MAVTEFVTVVGPRLGLGATDEIVVDGTPVNVSEVNRLADVSARLVTLTGDTTLTEATHEGKILLLGEVGGNTALAVTLPAATGSGARFHFKVSVVNTSGYTIKVTGDDTMDGQIISCNDTDATVSGWETAADSDTITLNGTTTGGTAIGNWIELVDIAADQWAVSGQTTASGIEATPFSAAVV